MRMQKLKRSLALALTLVLVIGLFPAMALAAETPTFTDIPSWDTSGSVDYIAAKGITSGVGEGKFGYANKLTKKGYFTFIDKFLGFSAGDKVALSHFTDVAGIGEPYESAIAALAYQGTITATTVSPNATVSRELAFTTLAKILGLAENKAALSRVNDSAKVSDWAQGWVGALIATGVIGGDQDNNINPKSEFTRGGMAILLRKVFGYYVNTSGKHDLNNATTENLTIKEANTLVKNTHVTGDLIIGAGVLDGEVYLDGVTVDGKLLVFGGGSNSIKIQGKSNIKNVVTAKHSDKGQPVRIAVAKTATVGSVSVNAGVKATVTGAVESVKLDTGSELKLDAATVTTVEVAGAEAKLDVENSKVETIAVDKEAVEATVTLNKASVGEVSTDAAGSKITATESAIVTVTVTVNATKADTNLGAGTTIGTITITATFTTTEVDVAATITKIVAEVAAVLTAEGKVGEVSGAAATEVKDAAGAAIDTAALAAHEGSGKTIEEATVAADAVVVAAEAAAEAEVEAVNAAAEIPAETDAVDEQPAGTPETPADTTPSAPATESPAASPTPTSPPDTGYQPPVDNTPAAAIVGTPWYSHVGGLTLITVTVSNPTGTTKVTATGKVIYDGTDVEADKDIATEYLIVDDTKQYRLVLDGTFYPQASGKTSYFTVELS
jgi:hypothetical protein